MQREEEKRTSVLKVIIVAVIVALVVIAAVVILYKLFKKHFKVSLDCGDCDDCAENCFGDDFDPLCLDDEDFVPVCNLDDEGKDA